MNTVVRQTLALVLDQYRELNSRKLFWVTLGLSLIIVLAFAALGITDSGITFLWWQFDVPFLNLMEISTADFYKMMFVSFGIQIWLAWLATILALVSTAGIIPDFIAGGAVELTLSKPISRLRLFLTKFFCGLLFVALQVSVFTGASFVVIGLRGGVWEPGLFLAIPITVLFFSYLYSVCVLIGLITRSTIAALLLTLLVWFFFFALNLTDGIILSLREQNLMKSEALQREIARTEKSTTPIVYSMRKAQAIEAARAGLGAASDGTVPELDESKVEYDRTPPKAEELDQANPILKDKRRQLEETKENEPRWAIAAKSVVMVKTVFPKTTETTGLLDRWLREAAELPEVGNDEEDSVADGFGPRSRREREELEARLDRVMRNRTTAWVLGTSGVFVIVMLGISTIIFVRRDF